MEKQLIAEDMTLLKNIESDLKYFTPALLEVKEAYNALDLQQFDNEVFIKIKNNGYETIRAKAIDDLDSQLLKAGIKNSTLRENSLNALIEPLSRLYNAIEKLKSVQVLRSNPRSEAVLELTQISFIDDSFIISEAEQEKFAEIHCRTYLSNANHVALVNDLNSVVALLNKLGTEHQDLIFDPRESHKTPQQAFQRLVDVHRTDWSFFVNQRALKSILK